MITASVMKGLKKYDESIEIGIMDEKLSMSAE